MKKSLTAIFVIAAFALGVVLTSAFTTNQHPSEHPRLHKAIEQMEDAISYMQAAPHDFGGHKAQAIADTKAAIASLRAAESYHAR